MLKIWRRQNLHYMVLRGDSVEGEDSEAGLRLVEVSLSPYHIQDYEDCGEDQIEKLPLAGPIHELVPSLLKPITTPMHSKSGSETVLTLRRCSRHVVTRGLTAVAMSLRRHQTQAELARQHHGGR